MVLLLEVSLLQLLFPEELESLSVVVEVLLVFVMYQIGVFMRVAVVFKFPTVDLNSSESSPRLRLIYTEIL